MEDQQIHFDDGAEYEEFMGKWSRLAGDAFLDWLVPPPALRWLDVGCGNGAFTEMLVGRCGAIEVEGIDPSEAQLDFARTRLAGAPVRFRQGDAMALPYADAAFDAAVMALVLFFVPDPAMGVAEMARVVRPGGSVCAYVWNFAGGGFPIAAVHEEMAAFGTPPLWPPSWEASRLGAMKELWADAGLIDIDSLVIDVTRTFTDFETFWTIARTGPGVAPKLAGMAPCDVEQVVARLRQRLETGTGGAITVAANANAIRGTLPG